MTGSDAGLYWRYRAEQAGGAGDRAWRLKDRDDPSPASVAYFRILGEVMMDPVASTELVIRIVEAAPAGDDARVHLCAGVVEDWVDGIPSDEAVALIRRAAARSPVFGRLLAEGIEARAIWTDRGDLVRRALGQG
ncbi:hypothetical protein [Cryptosporangium minutisporangium]|uniref:HEAT repeat domain-containing protein n=1 Tax=Cryptosporangium minutisporangium TaxID=113569 RepID=A0ABP6SQ64_9ACTN